MPLILIVDDDVDATESLRTDLMQQGHAVRVVHGAVEALSSRNGLRDPLPDLVLVEQRLPDLSGTEVCRRLRADERVETVGIIMLSARDEEIDRVVAFEVGADDFVAKPYSSRELMLRVRALLRRAAPNKLAAVPETQVSFGLIRMDPSAHQAWVDGSEIVLTALEFRLLRLLIERRGRVQSRDRLLNDVWSIESTQVTTRTVDTHVKRLRKKLGPASGYIETLRGVGYRCAARPADL